MMRQRSFAIPRRRFPSPNPLLLSKWEEVQIWQRESSSHPRRCNKLQVKRQWLLSRTDCLTTRKKQSMRQIARNRHAGEININVEGYVEIVGEDIQRNMSDDFGDLSIREALVAKRLYATRGHLPTRVQQFTRKRQRRCVLG